MKRYVACLVAALALPGCWDGDGGPTDVDDIVKVEVTPAADTVLVGATSAFTARALDRAGDVVAGAALAWSSLNTTVATVDANGVATGLKKGTAIIAATSGGAVGLATLVVRQPLPPVQVAEVLVAPAAVAIEVGVAQQFTASPRNSSGEVIAGIAVEWSSSDPAVAAVSATGLATGLAPGVTNIRATAQGVSGTGVLTVAPPSEGLVWSVDFNLAPLAMLEGVWGSSGSDVYAVGTSDWYCCPVVFHYDGTTWSGTSLPSVPGLNQLTGVWGSSASDVFAVGTGGANILHYDGSSWSAMESNAGEVLWAVWGSAANDVYAVGHATVLHFDGSAWTRMSAPIGQLDLTDVWGAGPGDVFAVGTGGVILHYDGTGWKAMPSPTSAALLSVWGSGANDVYAVGMGGTILHFDGTAWTRMASPAQGEVAAVWGSSAGDVYFAEYQGPWYPTGRGIILRYDGTRWSATLSPTGHAPLDMWGSSGDDVFIVGTGGVILHGTR